MQGSILTVLTLTWVQALGCSLTEMPPKYSMEHTLEKAPVVVSGKDIQHETGEEGFRNYTFKVSCVFKSNDLEIPRTIFLIDVGATTCDGTEMEPVGRLYVVALRQATDEQITRTMPENEYYGKDSPVPLYYVVYEPDAHNTGAFEATAGNLNKTSQLCEIDDVIQSLGEGGPDDHECPVRTVTTETCVSGAPAVVLSLVLCALISLVLVL